MSKFVSPSKFFVEFTENNENFVTSILLADAMTLDKYAIGTSGGTFVLRLDGGDAAPILTFVYTAKGAENAFGDAEEGGELFMDYRGVNGEEVGYKAKISVNAEKAKCLVDLFATLDPAEYSIFATALTE